MGKKTLINRKQLLHDQSADKVTVSARLTLKCNTETSALRMLYMSDTLMWTLAVKYEVPSGSVFFKILFFNQN